MRQETARTLTKIGCANCGFVGIASDTDPDEPCCPDCFMKTKIYLEWLIQEYISDE